MGDLDKQWSHKSGSLKHFYEHRNEGDELSSGTRSAIPGHRKWVLCAQRVSKAETLRVFRKWASDEKLLTQRIPGLNSPHPAIHLIGSNYSWSYCSNSTKGWLVCGVLICLPHTTLKSQPTTTPKDNAVYRTMVKSMVFGAKEASVSPAFLSVRLWGSCLTALCLNFHICKMGIIQCPPYRLLWG